MKSYGPKPLIKIGGETIIARQIRLIRELTPQCEIVVVLGSEADRIRKHLPKGIRIVYNPDFETTNVARSVALGIRACSNTGVLVVYGDLVFNQTALRTFLLSPPTSSAILVDSHGQFGANEVGVNVVDGEASFFCYGLPTKWLHILYLNSADSRTFQLLAMTNNKKKWYGYEILNLLLENDRTILAMEPSGLLAAEVDSSRDFASALRVVENRS